MSRLTKPYSCFLISSGWSLKEKRYLHHTPSQPHHHHYHLLYPGVAKKLDFFRAQWACLNLQGCLSSLCKPMTSHRGLFEFIQIVSEVTGGKIEVSR